MSIHPEKDDEISDDSLKLKKIEFVESRLKILFCAKFEFKSRNVFKIKKINDDLLHAGEVYKWPDDYKHSKARDSHPDLHERFPVKDHQISWSYAGNDLSYDPEYATEEDSADPDFPRNPAKDSLNPCGR